MPIDDGHFGDPDREASARIICHGGPRPELVLNVRSDENVVCERDDLRQRWGPRRAVPRRHEPMRVETTIATSAR